MLRRAAIDAQRLSFDPQFAGMASGARDVQVLLIVAGIQVAGETHRQIAGVVRGRLLVGIDQETEARQVLGGGETLLRERQFQRGKPVVTQAFYLGALGGVVVDLAVVGAPLIEIVHLINWHVLGESRVGDVIQNHRQAQAEQGDEQQQGTANQAQVVASLSIYTDLMPEPMRGGKWPFLQSKDVRKHDKRRLKRGRMTKSDCDVLHC